MTPPINVNDAQPLKLCSTTLNDVTCTKQEREFMSSGGKNMTRSVSP